MADPVHVKRFDRALAALREIPDPLRRLDAVRRSREALDELEAATVADARAAGVTWIDIGALYGLSKQGAQQRFRRPRSHRHVRRPRRGNSQLDVPRAAYFRSFRRSLRSYRLRRQQQRPPTYRRQVGPESGADDPHGPSCGSLGFVESGNSLAPGRWGRHPGPDIENLGAGHAVDVDHRGVTGSWAPPPTATRSASTRPTRRRGRRAGIAVRGQRQRWCATAAGRDRRPGDPLHPAVQPTPVASERRPWASGAADALLDQLGFTDVVRDAGGIVTAATPDAAAGYDPDPVRRHSTAGLSRWPSPAARRRGRPDGGAVFLDVDRAAPVGQPPAAGRRLGVPDVLLEAVRRPARRADRRGADRPRAAGRRGVGSRHHHVRIHPAPPAASSPTIW